MADSRSATIHTAQMIPVYQERALTANNVDHH